MAKKIFPVTVALFALAIPAVAGAAGVASDGLFGFSDLLLFGLGIGGLLIGRQASRA